MPRGVAARGIRLCVYNNIIIIIITLQYDVHVIEGEGLQSVSEQVVGVHTDRICQVDIPGLKLNLYIILMVILTICTTRTNYMITTNVCWIKMFMKHCKNGCRDFVWSLKKVERDR